MGLSYLVVLIMGLCFLVGISFVEVGFWEFFLYIVLINGKGFLFTIVIRNVFWQLNYVWISFLN
jgi:hypothetical protein